MSVLETAVSLASRFSPGNASAMVAEGIASFISSRLRLGLVIKFGSRKIIVEESDDIIDDGEELIVPSGIIVRSGMTYYLVEFDVTATKIKLEKVKDE